MFPTPHTVSVSSRDSTLFDDHGVPVESWTTPVEHNVCAVYVTSSAEPFTAGHERVIVDARIIAPTDFPAGPHDRIHWNDQVFEVIGWAEDYTSGPWWNPGVKLWNLRRLEGQ